MRWSLLSRVCLVLAVASGLSVSGCGSSDDKKSARRYSGGGEGGDATGEAGGSGSGGTGATGATAGTAGSAGDAGSDTAGDAGSGTGSGGDAGAGAGTPQGGASEGGAGGEGPVVPFHGLYIGENGDDEAAGTIEAPFETLAHAASVAQAGDTIVFLDGTYAANSFVTIPAGVNLMANTTGAATVTGSVSGLLRLSGDHRIEGLRFQGYARAAYYGAGVDATGTLTVIDSTFVSCAVGLELSGTVSAVVSADETFVVANGGNTFAALTEEASLSMQGGILRNYDSGSIIHARYESSVSLSNVQVLDGTGVPLTVREDAVAELSDVTLATRGQILIDTYNNAELTITGSDLSIHPTVPTPYNCILGNVHGSGALTIIDSALHDCGTAIGGDIPGPTTLTNVDISGVDFGIDIGASAGNAGGTIRITNSTFDDLGFLALRIGSGGDLNDFKIRDSSFTCPASSTWNCLIFDGSNASIMDLGTLAEPGNNTFLHSNVNQTAVWLGFQAVDSTAVGNTWIPSVQNADNMGKYNAPAGAGQKLLITMTNNVGRNYQMPYGGTLLLAENP